MHCATQQVGAAGLGQTAPSRIHRTRQASNQAGKFNSLVHVLMLIRYSIPEVKVTSKLISQTLLCEASQRPVLSYTSKGLDRGGRVAIVDSIPSSRYQLPADEISNFARNSSANSVGRFPRRFPGGSASSGIRCTHLGEKGLLSRAF